MLNYPKVTAFKTCEEFSRYLTQEGWDIGLATKIPADGTAALARKISWQGRTIGNRWAILPMEGWDCEANGVPSEFTKRRWMHFATSGAKLICGTEAGAVIHSGRGNPRQLLVNRHTLPALKQLVKDMRKAHRDKFGTDDDLCIGLQLTHSGRFSHPNSDDRPEPVTAYSHPLLDIKFNCSAGNIISDEAIGHVTDCFAEAAQVAYEAGFDFVDIKHAHGYLGHEFLTAMERPGPYGGTFENRTRFCREILDKIRSRIPKIALAVRLSIFDSMPFIKGSDGVGIPMQWPAGTPYPYAFGGDGSGLEMDPLLTEPVEFVKMLQEYGIDLICATIGSPYYSVHLQRPAYYPVSDGYLIPEPPLRNVGRHLQAVRELRKRCPGIVTVASGLTCLQEFLPNAAEFAVANRWTDFVGIGRMAISYPDICHDVLEGNTLDRCRICRTFGECTNAPRNGMISGCYPLDDFYKNRQEATILRNMKKTR